MPFSIHNLPYGVFNIGKQTHIGVAFGNDILDLTLCDALGFIDAPSFKNQWVFTHNNLNRLISLGATAWAELRSNIQFLLSDAQSPLQLDAENKAKVMVSQGSVQMKLPLHIGDYTDFYAAKAHAQRVGELFRGAAAALNENWLQMPIAYHGRSSSIVVSGSPVYRPQGIYQTENGLVFDKTKALDFELEAGFIIGAPNKRGQAIAIQDANGHIFGACLLNDWSARDIQRFEYQPLGPFLGKNFCTTISPWIVPFAALVDCQVPLSPQHPSPLPHLQWQDDFSLDIAYEVQFKSDKMQMPITLCKSNHQDLYWSPAQMLTHHSSNGCNLKVGDILGTGTISGAATTAQGCLLEITQNGTQPFMLPTGESRIYLEDGDTVTLSATAKGKHGDIYFGECVGVIC
jgi:fumarylacetoacetase